MRDTLWILRDKKIAVWGLTFKGDTDDIRSSVSIDLIKDLIKEGAHVTAYDPKGMDNVRSFKLIPEAKLVDSALAAAQGAEALIIATEWHEFAKVDLNQLKETMASPLVFDGRNLLDPNSMHHLGFTYHSIGRPQAAKS